MPIKRIALYIPAEMEYPNRVGVGVAEFIREHGGLSLRDFRYPGESDNIELPQTWNSWRPDGIVAFVSSSTRRDQSLAELGIPAINTSSDADQTILPRVITDRSVLAKLAVGHICDRRYKGVGFVGVRESVGSFGYETAVQEELAQWDRQGTVCRLETNPSAALEHQISSASTEPKLHEFLTDGDKPLGVLTANEAIGQAVADASRILGLKIPADVGIIAMTELGTLRAQSPGISAIEAPATEVGVEAMHLLSRLLRGESLPATTVEIAPTRLVVRGSTGCDLDRELTLKHAQEMILAKAGVSITVREIVESMAVSRKSFEKQYAARFGLTPGEEILRVRLARSQELLLTTELSIQAISYMVGYQSVSNFGDFFRRRTGISPREYRKQCQAHDHQQ